MASLETHDQCKMVNRKVRVMLTIDGLGLGGAEMVVRNLAHGLNRELFDVCICCTKGLGGDIGEELLEDGFDVFVLPGKHDERVDYLTTLKFFRTLRKRNIDIVHTHATAALLDAAPCRIIMPHVKVIHTFHYGNYPYDSLRHHLLECFFSRAVDKLVAVGIEQQRRIKKTYKIRDSRISLVWNGVKIPTQTSGKFINKITGDGDYLLVGTIAKLIEQKGLDDLLYVAKRCHDTGRRIKFLIVGEGHLRQKLEQLRHELRLDDVVLFSGWVNNAAAHVLPTFDIFFQPSRWEAMSLSILEAMASGKAIVATMVGDNPYVIKNKISGLLLEPGDVEGMADALISLSDSRQRDKFGQAAKANFEQNFTVQRMINDYESIYRSIV